MDTRARKLSKALGVEYAVALRLVGAGLTTENRAKKADAKTLTEIEGIGAETAAQIRGE